jgi:hypothetical protein
VSDRAPVRLYFGKPVYRCRFCRFERVERIAAVLEHEGTCHPGVEEAEPAPPLLRESQFVLGPDGNPALLEERAAERR